jgi:hypothetical protein
MREAPIEAYYGFCVTTRYMRVYVENSRSDYQPRIHGMWLRLRGPSIDLPAPRTRKHKRGKHANSDANTGPDGAVGNSEGTPTSSSSTSLAWGKQSEDPNQAQPEHNNNGKDHLHQGSTSSRTGHKLPLVPINVDVGEEDFHPDSLLHIR